MSRKQSARLVGPAGMALDAAREKAKHYEAIYKEAKRAYQEALTHLEDCIMPAVDEITTLTNSTPSRAVNYTSKPSPEVSEISQGNRASKKGKTRGVRGRTRSSRAT